MEMTKTDMQQIWAQKLREIDEEIRNTPAFDIGRLEFLAGRKNWLEFGFNACGGSGE